MLSTRELKFGCDPEVFLRDKWTKDFVSAFGLFPGTKKNPYPLDRGAVQVDGMALEFNIIPASTKEEFVRNIIAVKSQITEMVDKVGNNDLEIVYEPVANFDRDYFNYQPFEPKILGCDPDFDENGIEKTPPDGMQDRPFRTAAGHVHIGFTEGADPRSPMHFENCKRIAKAFKNYSGYVPVTAAERQRVQFYGKPGSFRPKSYGIELRSPSNLWIRTPEEISQMFDRTASKVKDVLQ